MDFEHEIFLAFPVICGLSACGGSNEPVTTGPTFSTVNSFTGLGGSQTYDAATDTYTLTRSGAAEAVVAGNVAFDIGTFDGARNGSGQGVFVSRTDDSQVALMVYSGESSPVTVRFRTFNETTVPASGDATLTGSYVGVLTNSSTDAVVYLLTGDASLTMDWASLTASGEITNRVLLDPTTNAPIVGVSVADFELGTSTEFTDSGTFSGEATGGSIDATTVIGAPTFLGTNLYSGHVTGATGDEAIGMVTAIHNVVGGGPFRREEGAYALGH